MRLCKAASMSQKSPNNPAKTFPTMSPKPPQHVPQSSPEPPKSIPKPLENCSKNMIF